MALLAHRDRIEISVGVTPRSISMDVRVLRSC